jgi:cell division protein FtsB
VIISKEGRELLIRLQGKISALEDQIEELKAENVDLQTENDELADGFQHCVKILLFGISYICSIN